MLGSGGLRGAKYVRDDGCAGAADVLGHRDFRIAYLVFMRASCQLLYGLDDLINARRPDRVPACFQTTHRRDGEPASERIGPFSAEGGGLTRASKACCLQTKRRDDRKSIVELEQIDVFRA